MGGRANFWYIFLGAISPLSSNSHHQDFYILCNGSLEIFICGYYWEGGQPKIFHSLRIGRSLQEILRYIPGIRVVEM